MLNNKNLNIELMIDGRVFGSISIQGSVISTIFKKNIVSIETIPDRTVAYGTIFEDLDLPQTIRVFLADNTSEVIIGIIWDEGDYNETIEDTYIINGTIILPDHITNTDDLFPTISIEVVPTINAINVVIPSLQFGVNAIATYEFVENDDIKESNKPIYAEELVITATTFFVGEVATAVFNRIVIPNGGGLDNHIYTWYRCLDTRETSDILISGATGSSYVITEDDAGTFLRCEGILRQIGGGNLSGETMYSLHSSIVLSSTFNPYANILWQTAHVPIDIVNFSGLTYWANRGTLNASIQDSTFALPTYDPAEQALKFIRASSQRLLLTKQSPTMTVPYEIWTRFKLSSLTGNKYLFGFTNSSYLYINSTGFLVINGNVSTVSFSTSTWYVMRLVTNGTSTSIEINHGGSVITNGGTASPSTGQGRIGCAYSKSNFFDGWISHVFIKDQDLTLPEQNDMWAYFGY